MAQWMCEHPWMTFFIILSALYAVVCIVQFICHTIEYHTRIHAEMMIRVNKFTEIKENENEKKCN